MHKLMDFIGVESDRLYIDWVSASEGKRFAEVVTNFTQKVREIGHLVIERDPHALDVKLDEVTA